MKNQFKITRVLKGGSSHDGKLAVFRVRDQENEEWQLFFPPDLAVNLLTAIQGAAIYSANQRKEPPSPKLLEALKIRDLTLTGIRTHTGQTRAVLRLDLDDGLEIEQRVELENLRQLVEAGQELLDGFDDRTSQSVQ
jgi:hypothetical protein